MSFKISEIREILGDAFTDDIAKKLVNLHRTVVDPLLEQVQTAESETKKYKTEAEKVPGLEQKVKDLESGEDFKAKYEKEHSDFEAYKGEISKKETADKIATAYRKLLADKHIKADKIDFIVAHTDLSKAVLGKDGVSLENAGDFEKEITDTVNGWGGYIVTEEKRKTSIGNPPEGDTGAGTSRARELYINHMKQQGIEIKDAGKE